MFPLGGRAEPHRTQPVGLDSLCGASLLRQAPQAHALRRVGSDPPYSSSSEGPAKGVARRRRARYTVVAHMATGDPKAVRRRALRREREMAIAAAAGRAGTGFPTSAPAGLPPEAFASLAAGHQAAPAAAGRPPAAASRRRASVSSADSGAPSPTPWPGASPASNRREGHEGIVVVSVSTTSQKGRRDAETKEERGDCPRVPGQRPLGDMAHGRRGAGGVER